MFGLSYETKGLFYLHVSTATPKVLGCLEMEVDSSPGKRFTNFDLWNCWQVISRVIVFKKIYAHLTPTMPVSRWGDSIAYRHSLPSVSIAVYASNRGTSSSWNRVSVMKNQRARCEPLFIRFIIYARWLQVNSKQVICRKRRDVITMIMHRNFPRSSMSGP